MSRKIDIHEFVFEECSDKHLHKILKLQEETLNNLPSNDILRENSIEMLGECLKPPHVTLGAWHNNELIAFSILYYPYNDEENLAINLKDVDISDYNIANNKLCIVKNEFRGNSLQYELGIRIEKIAILKGTKLMCVTVSPRNTYSIRNIIRLGFIYNRNLIKYDGKERQLYYKFI